MHQEAFDLPSTQILSLYALGSYLATRPQLTVSETGWSTTWELLWKQMILEYSYTWKSMTLSITQMSSISWFSEWWMRGFSWKCHTLIFWENELLESQRWTLPWTAILWRAKKNNKTLVPYCSGVGGEAVRCVTAHLWTEARQHCRTQCSATRQCFPRCVFGFLLSYICYFASSELILCFCHYAACLIYSPLHCPCRQGRDAKGHTCRIQRDAPPLDPWISEPSAGCHGESGGCSRWWCQAVQRHSKDRKIEPLIMTAVMNCVCSCRRHTQTHQKEAFFSPLETATACLITSCLSSTGFIKFSLCRVRHEKDIVI